MERIEEIYPQMTQRDADEIQDLELPIINESEISKLKSISFYGIFSSASFCVICG